MSMDQLAQNPSQTWTIMDHSHHQHYYFQQGSSHSKEHMFEKPLTPSDVGKLNRLVIPKQHAERYFPLDSEAGEKGLLLNFEDESGKAWRFRYSYWTSSQSYVLTKGWSRFVKEKKLDAGDIVIFERYRPDVAGQGYCLFIGCRRRGISSDNSGGIATSAPAMQWGPYPTNPYLYMNSVNGGEKAGGENREIATGSTKRLRLFGVNMEFCPDHLGPQL